MRKIILGLAITLDGYIEGPSGEYDWCFTDQDYGLKEFFSRIDALFMGRKSYDIARKHGDQNPWGEIRTYVFSRSPDHDAAVTWLTADEDTIDRIRNENGKDIWLFGGAEITRLFLARGWVDEVWLSIHPVLLGGGKLLFDSVANRTQLKLLNCKAYSTGLVSLRYEVLSGRSG
jgi:dihydrofolate reductase